MSRPASTYRSARRSFVWSNGRRSIGPNTLRHDRDLPWDWSQHRPKARLYDVGGAREVARYKRQIAAGHKGVANGVVR